MGAPVKSIMKCLPVLLLFKYPVEIYQNPANDLVTAFLHAVDGELLQYTFPVAEVLMHLLESVLIKMEIFTWTALGHIVGFLTLFLGRFQRFG